MQEVMKNALEQIIGAARHDTKFNAEQAFKILDKDALFQYCCAKELEDTIIQTNATESPKRK